LGGREGVKFAEEEGHIIIAVDHIYYWPLLFSYGVGGKE
jgi:hypothetical protein